MTETKTEILTREEEIVLWKKELNDLIELTKARDQEFKTKTEELWQVRSEMKRLRKTTKSLKMSIHQLLRKLNRNGEKVNWEQSI